MADFSRLVSAFFTAHGAKGGRFSKGDWASCSQKLMQLLGLPQATSFDVMDSDRDGEISISEFEEEVARLVELCGRRSVASALSRAVSGANPSMRPVSAPGG